MKRRYHITLLILWTVIALPAVEAFGASPQDPYEREILLYDLDYRNLTNQIGQIAQITDTILQGGSSLNEQVFGKMIIHPDPHALSPTAALMTRGADLYSQFKLSLFDPACFFRSHRIEFSFMFDATVGSFTLFPDASGMLYRITFDSDGSVWVWYYSSVDNPDMNTTFMYLTSYNPAEPVTAELDLDRRDGKIKVTINEVESIIEDVGVATGPGLRNRTIIWSPIDIRCSYGESDSPLSLYYMRVWGGYWEGPLLLVEGQVTSDTTSKVFPVIIPSQGTWQGQYSFDLNTWVPYGGYFEGSNSYNRLLPGSRIFDECFFRLQEIQEE